MRKYRLEMEGWVTDTVFVTAADKPEAVKVATQEFINRKGCENARASVIEEIEND